MDNQNKQTTRETRRPRQTAMVWGLVLALLTAVQTAELRAQKKTSADLATAIKSNDLKTFKELIATYSNQPIGAEAGRSALTLTIIYNRSAMFRIAITKGGLNRGDRLGKTPLMYACERGNMPAIAALLKRGASLKQTDKYKQTVMHYGAMTGRPEVVAYLLKRNLPYDEPNARGFTPFLVAVFNSDVKTALLLAGKGADVNRKTYYGHTALMIACWKKKPDMVKMLISKGAKLDETSSLGVTAEQLSFRSPYIRNILRSARQRKEQ